VAAAAEGRAAADEAAIEVAEDAADHGVKAFQWKRRDGESHPFFITQ
jgi:hypothetical protein